MALWVVLLFAAAGTLHWVRGWICLGVYFITMTITGMVMKYFNRDLIQARSKWRKKNTAAFDKLFLATFIPLTFVQVALAGLDAVRFRWSSMPSWTLYAGIVIYLAGIALVSWALAINPFAETSVRIQSERGHTVVTSGPYSFVRHPMYVGSSLIYPATALMLGPQWALLTSFILVAMLIVRTALEDETLRRDLLGYEDYVSATQYRLVPRVW